MSVYGPHCEHVYVNEGTGRPALPFVLAGYVEHMPIMCRDDPPMFLGRRYRCLCGRTIDLTHREYGKLPEVPVSYRRDEVLRWD